MKIPPIIQWCMGIGIALIIAVVPFVHYRVKYTTYKRLRVVADGKVYRSGCMTALGMRETIQRLGIRTVINLQDEAPDPDLEDWCFGGRAVKESELCKELGVRFVFLPVELVHPTKLHVQRPATIARFLQIMDDPETYPVLIHCRAGLHRTGCLMALYRMEYDGWSKDDAICELKAHGFGEWASTSANDYIVQYILSYRPRPRDDEGRLIEPSAPRLVPALTVSHPGEFKPLPTPPE